MQINSQILSEALNLDVCPKFESNEISIDSRTITSGNIFFAIKGNSFDGNKFAAEAISKGAAVAIISDEKHKTDDRMILVNDTTEALKKLGLYIKNKASPKTTIGITGSAGKTTTRTWLSNILSHNHKVFSSIKNYNTIYGLPISLSLMEENCDFGIFEMGTNNPGEISELSQYLEPDMAIITNIYESHIGRFKNKEALAQEKISVINGLKNGSTLIYDGDSEFSENIKKAAQKKELKIISVGFKDGCDFSIISYENSNITLKTPFGIVKYNLECNAKHFAYISACIIATLFSLEINIEKHLKYFKNLLPLKGRGSILECEYNGKKFKVIDDSYNASPSSMIAAIERLASYKNLRKIAVIGQMGELGDKEHKFHELVSQKINTLKIDKVFFIGDKKLHNTFNAECFPEINTPAIEKMLEIIKNNDIILLKGSNSIGLNRFFNHIK